MALMAFGQMKELINIVLKAVKKNIFKYLRNLKIFKSIIFPREINNLIFFSTVKIDPMYGRTISLK
jgi:hypothetical protein